MLEVDAYRRGEVDQREDTDSLRGELEDVDRVPTKLPGLPPILDVVEDVIE